jgi:hypothetical protein
MRVEVAKLNGGAGNNRVGTVSGMEVDGNVAI